MGGEEVSTTVLVSGGRYDEGLGGGVKTGSETERQTEVREDGGGSWVNVRRGWVREVRVDHSTETT